LIAPSVSVSPAQRAHDAFCDKRLFLRQTPRRFSPTRLRTCAHASHAVVVLATLHPFFTEKRTKIAVEPVVLQ
jgi:hypothetical protein